MILYHGNKEMPSPFISPIYDIDGSAFPLIWIYDENYQEYDDIEDKDSLSIYTEQFFTTTDINTSSDEQNLYSAIYNKDKNYLMSYIKKLARIYDGKIILPNEQYFDFNHIDELKEVIKEQVENNEITISGGDIQKVEIAPNEEGEYEDPEIVISGGSSSGDSENQAFTLLSMQDGSTVKLNNIKSTEIIRAWVFNKNKQPIAQYDNLKSTDVITLNEGYYVEFENIGYNNVYNTNYKYFSMTGIIEAHGNLATLVIPLNAADAQSTLPDYACYRLFYGCSALTTAPYMKGFKTIGTGAMYGMFEECISLVEAPLIQADYYSVSSYQNMFKGCKSLTTIPEGMNFGTSGEVANNAFNATFYQCSALVDASNISDIIIDSRSIGQNEFANMFSYCTNLEKAANIIAHGYGQDVNQGAFFNTYSYSPKLRENCNIDLSEYTTATYFTQSIRYTYYQTGIETMPFHFGDGSGLLNEASFMMFGDCQNLTEALDVSKIAFMEDGIMSCHLNNRSLHVVSLDNLIQGDNIEVMYNQRFASNYQWFNGCDLNIIPNEIKLVPNFRYTDYFSGNRNITGDITLDMSRILWDNYVYLNRSETPNDYFKQMFQNTGIRSLTFNNLDFYFVMRLQNETEKSLFYNIVNGCRNLKRVSFIFTGDVSGLPWIGYNKVFNGWYGDVRDIEVTINEEYFMFGGMDRFEQILPPDSYLAINGTLPPLE